MRDQVSHLYKTAGKIVILYLYILIKFFKKETDVRSSYKMKPNRIFPIKPQNFILRSVTGT